MSLMNITEYSHPTTEHPKLETPVNTEEPVVFETMPELPTDFFNPKDEDEPKPNTYWYNSKTQGVNAINIPRSEHEENIDYDFKGGRKEIYRKLSEVTADAQRQPDPVAYIQRQLDIFIRDSLVASPDGDKKRNNYYLQLRLLSSFCLMCFKGNIRIPNKIKIMLTDTALFLREKLNNEVQRQKQEGFKGKWTRFWADQKKTWNGEDTISYNENHTRFANEYIKIVQANNVVDFFLLQLSSEGEKAMPTAMVNFDENGLPHKGEWFDIMMQKLLPSPDEKNPEYRDFRGKFRTSIGTIFNIDFYLVGSSRYISYNVSNIEMLDFNEGAYPESFFREIALKTDPDVEITPHTRQVPNNRQFKERNNLTVVSRLQLKLPKYQDATIVVDFERKNNIYNEPNVIHGAKVMLEMRKNTTDSFSEATKLYFDILTALIKLKETKSG